MAVGTAPGLVAAGLTSEMAGPAAGVLVLPVFPWLPGLVLMLPVPKAAPAVFHSQLRCLHLCSEPTGLLAHPVSVFVSRLTGCITCWALMSQTALPQWASAVMDSPCSSPWGCPPAHVDPQLPLSQTAQCPDLFSHSVHSSWALSDQLRAASELLFEHLEGVCLTSQSGEVGVTLLLTLAETQVQRHPKLSRLSLESSEALCEHGHMDTHPSAPVWPKSLGALMRCEGYFSGQASFC